MDKASTGRRDLDITCTARLLYHVCIHHRDTEGTKVLETFMSTLLDTIVVWLYAPPRHGGHRGFQEVFMSTLLDTIVVWICSPQRHRGHRGVCPFILICASVVITNQTSFAGDYRSRTTRKPAASTTIMATSTARCGAISFSVAPR